MYICMYINPDLIYSVMWKGTRDAVVSDVYASPRSYVCNRRSQQISRCLYSEKLVGLADCRAAFTLFANPSRIHVPNLQVATWLCTPMITLIQTLSHSYRGREREREKRQHTTYTHVHEHNITDMDTHTHTPRHTQAHT